jgi:uncharacterized protein (UPF0332 family)
MSCTPHDLYALAHKLTHAEDPCETELRCAISRAYYSALHSVTETFPKREDQFRANGESSHAEIIGRVTAFGNGIGPGRSDAALIAKLMPRLRRRRNDADYRLNEEVKKDEVCKILDRAKEVIDRCANVVRLQESSNRRIG